MTGPNPPTPRWLCSPRAAGQGSRTFSLRARRNAACRVALRVNEPQSHILRCRLSWSPLSWPEQASDFTATERAPAGSHGLDRRRGPDSGWPAPWPGSLGLRFLDCKRGRTTHYKPQGIKLNGTQENARVAGTRV